MDKGQGRDQRNIVQSHISGVQNMEGMDGTGAVLRADGFCAADDDCNNRERLVAWLRTWRITLREML